MMVFDNPWVYYTLVLSLAMTLFSALMLLKLALAKKGLISKAAKYFTAGMVIWSIAVFAMILTEVEIDATHFLLLLSIFIGNFFILWGALQLGKIHNILSPSKPTTPSLFCKPIILLAVAFPLIGLAYSILGLGFSSLLLGGMSTLTALSLLLLALANVSPHSSRLSWVPLQLAYLPLLLGALALLGHLLGIPYLYSPFTTAGTSIPTAISIVFLSMATLSIPRLFDDRVKVITGALLFSSLLFAVFSLVGYALSSPALYFMSPFARLSPLTALTLFLLSVDGLVHLYKVL